MCQSSLFSFAAHSFDVFQFSPRKSRSGKEAHLFKNLLIPQLLCKMLLILIKLENVALNGAQFSTSNNFYESFLVNGRNQ